MLLRIGLSAAGKGIDAKTVGAITVKVMGEVTKK
jgi:hypothetical protein